MISHSKTSHKPWTQGWVHHFFLRALMPMVGVWGTGTAAKSGLTKRYPPPGRMGQSSPTVILEAGILDFPISWCRH